MSSDLFRRYLDIVTEMDKSAPQPGRDGKVSHSTYGSRDKEGSDYFKGREAPSKVITAKQMSKDAVDILKKSGVAEGFPYDVDHMPGPVIRNADMTTDNVKTTDKAHWDRAVKSINAKVFDDMSEFRTDSNGERVVGNSAVWAKWDNKTQTGWFNAKGRPLKPWPVKEHDGVAEGYTQDRFDEPLTGWHIVSKAHGQVVRGTPSFETKDQAQKYLMTRMFADHHLYKVVHTAGVTEGSDKLQGTPVVSLSDFGDKDTKKDKYGRTVPKKLKKDDPRVKFYKDEKQGVAEGMSGQVIFSGTGDDGGKYEIVQTGPTDFMIYANGKHIDTYQSAQRAMSVLKNEVSGLKKGVAEGKKTLANYIAESERAYSQPVTGDYFAINIREETLFETWVCDETADGIVIYADDQGLALLEHYGYLGEPVMEHYHIDDYQADSDGQDVDIVDQGEYDYEGDQARDQLKSIVRAAHRLNGIIDDEDNLPEWVQMKITKAEDYIDTAADYMESNREQDMDEAKYQGREVPLGKPMAGDVKKSKVYVRGPKGNVVKVNFGQKGMKIKKNIPGRRKNFRARHNCDNPGPRWKARYWSCRAW